MSKFSKYSLKKQSNCWRYFNFENSNVRAAAGTAGNLRRGIRHGDRPNRNTAQKKYRARDARCGRPARHFAEKRHPPPRRIPTPAHVRAPAGTRVGGTRGEGSGPGTAGVSGSHGKNLARRARGVSKRTSLTPNYQRSFMLNFT